MKGLLFGLTTAAALAGTACGGSAPAPSNVPQSTTVPAAQAGQNAAQAAQQMAQGLPQLNQNAAQMATAVNYERLVDLLPDAASGWTKSKPKGQQVNLGAAISNAEADYEKGESSIHLEITDTAFNQMYLTPLSMFLAANYSERSGSGYKKAAPIGGSPGFEKWDSDARLAEVTAVVGNRMIINAKGHNVENVDATRALVSAVDQSKLSTLK